MAIGMLEAKVAEAEKLSGETIPVETVLRLKHMIVSHHGEYGYGSPEAAHDARGRCPLLSRQSRCQGQAFQQLLRDDPMSTVPGPRSTQTSIGNCSRGREAKAEMPTSNLHRRKRFFTTTGEVRKESRI